MIDLRNEVNKMILAYIVKLDLTTQKTDIYTQKIDSLALETQKMVIANFLVQNRLRKV